METEGGPMLEEYRQGEQERERGEGTRARQGRIIRVSGGDSIEDSTQSL